jgi:peptide/nickel transport system substrate-binding protein
MRDFQYWERFSKQRLSRRRALSLTAAGIGATTLALVGCGGEEAKNGVPTSATGGSTPKTGGTLTQGNTSTALSIDPHTEVGQGLAYLPYMYGYLLHDIQYLDRAPEVMYDHCQSHEQPDEATYLFHLKQGIKFHNLPPVNGRELVAEDVLYSFDRLSTVGLEPFWRTYVASKTAPDPYTVELKLTKPYAYTIEDVGSVKAAIVPREAVEAWEDLKNQGLGSGPFVFKSFSRGERAEAVKNPDYHVPGVPRLDGMTWSTIADDSSLQVAFRAKQMDVYTAPSKIKADDVVGSSDGVILTKEPGLLIAKFGINELSLPELQDIRVREAIDIAFDRDGMIDKLAFGEGEYTGPVSWALGFWSLPQDELRRRLKQDLPKAKQLLEAAGASDLELELKFVAATHSDLSVMIKEHLGEAGINVNMIPQEIGTWRNDQASRAFQMQVGGGLPYPSEKYPLQFNHTANWTRAQPPTRQPEPEIDALLDKILETPDINERQVLVLDVTRKILDRHGTMFYLYAPYSYTLRWDYVHGYENVPSGKTLYTYDMWLDK